VNRIPEQIVSRRAFTGAALVLATLAVALRLLALDSDAYARLSWSSALLTDEGFYLHNARNLVLFGHTRTDAFNNMLIMPALHLAQTGLFTLLGVGAVPARLLSVTLSLLMLLVFYAALRRSLGRRVACLGVLFLGLDHVSVLYHRLALMDTPASCVLVCGFYSWVRGLQAQEARDRVVWLGGCGLLFGLQSGRLFRWKRPGRGILLRR